MKTQLVVMAAGMGSRFGGLKQIEPFGPHGEALLDFSIYDAAASGFDSAVVIIKKEIEREFRETVGKRIEKMIDVQYAYQQTGMLPTKYLPAPKRTKPWGTGHAVLCAAHLINAPFAVINADDYYGRGSYEIIHNQLASSDEMCMVGYPLGNTLTENGSVSRGVCETENGYLLSVVEHTEIGYDSGIPLDTTVSMNMWGFMPDFLDFLKDEFDEFLSENIASPKAEFYLPSAVSSRMKKYNMPVRVLKTDEQWYGVTYKQDAEAVRAAMRRFIDEGRYKFT